MAEENKKMTITVHSVVGQLVYRTGSYWMPGLYFCLSLAVLTKLDDKATIPPLRVPLRLRCSNRTTAVHIRRL